MSRTFHHGERRIRVRAIRRDPPDLCRLARALIELAQAEAEAAAQAEHELQQRKPVGTPDHDRPETTEQDQPDGDAA